jgi:hypothetical protein
MTRITTYMVLSVRGGFGGYDNGSWTEHMKLTEARETARRVSGMLYRRTRTRTDTGKDKETWRRIYQ